MSNVQAGGWSKRPKKLRVNQWPPELFFSESQPDRVLTFMYRCGNWQHFMDLRKFCPKKGITNVTFQFLRHIIGKTDIVLLLAL